jgi:hypothetical protein
VRRNRPPSHAPPRSALRPHPPRVVATTCTTAGRRHRDRKERTTPAPRCMLGSSRCPLTRACWLQQFPTGRPWSPTMPCFKCFRRFKLMFQVFHLGIAKVDVGCCICCNDNISMLQAYVSSVSHVFRRMFQVFHLDIAYVAMTLPACFKHVFKVFHTLCCKCFIWMLQK